MDAICHWFVPIRSSFFFFFFFFVQGKYGQQLTGGLNEVGSISKLHFCHVCCCIIFARSQDLRHVSSETVIGIALLLYISCSVYLCLPFQIGFVIDERLRGKGYKRKVGCFVPLIPLSPFLSHLLFHDCLLYWCSLYHLVRSQCYT